MNVKDVESHSHDHTGSQKLCVLHARGMGKSTGLVSSLDGSHAHHMGKHTHQWAHLPIPKMTPPELKEGEILCDKCEGGGALPTNKELQQHTYGNQMIQQTCPKCWGAGKLDWIESAMGKKPPDHFSTSAMPSHSHSIYGVTHSEMAIDEADFNLDEMGRSIAEAIDKEILDELSNTLQKEGSF